jgi:cytidyltransferase-like protein
MNIGLFGGTFDPIHKGHIVSGNKLRRNVWVLLFLPVPPHKTQAPLAYAERYAMVVLATMSERSFVPSLRKHPTLWRRNREKVNQQNKQWQALIPSAASSEI